MVVRRGLLSAVAQVGRKVWPQMVSFGNWYPLIERVLIQFKLSSRYFVIGPIIDIQTRPQHLIGDLIHTVLASILHRLCWPRRPVPRSLLARNVKLDSVSQHAGVLCVFSMEGGPVVLAPSTLTLALRLVVVDAMGAHAPAQR